MVLIRGQFWSRRLSLLRRWLNRRHHINAVTADGCNANPDDASDTESAHENGTEFIRDKSSDGHLHDCDEDSHDHPYRGNNNMKMIKTQLQKISEKQEYR